ncbi:MAG TPA: hypothetical protein VG892_13610, partial [Terriglobales bacterium]|nr:hypothetical protein [Terriglobales bacterium]
MSYFTDQGDLSPILRQSDANALVAAAFDRWTSIETAALVGVRAGSLDEDVSGANVTQSGQTVVLPPDVQANSSKPLAVVYDVDGAVTEACLGTGASTPGQCAANSVSGGIDRFNEDGAIVHAVLILNGRCVQSPGDVEAFRYRLVRMVGRILGLDGSQLNDSVADGSGTSEEREGFPLMHPLGSLCTSAGCIAGADQPRMDDRSAISRLYPVTSGNVASFPGKRIFSSTTGRVRGRVRFTGGGGMQGVNVVARLLKEDGQASGSAAVSSVSGFLFRGNAGNPVTGFTNDAGERWDKFGSGDPDLQGCYDLAGLEIPQGQTTVRYELRVEAVRPEYKGSLSVGPYRSEQVRMSGSADPIVVTIAAGSDIEQDIVMQGSPESSGGDDAQPFSAPAQLPGGGVWQGAIRSYGSVHYYSFQAQADRIATLEVQAVDESGAPTASKALPVIGIWPDTAVEGSPPAASAAYFDSASPGSGLGLTQLVAKYTLTRQFKLGIADYRGDGRPDFGYRARFFYAGDIEPVRASTAGGTVV